SVRIGASRGGHNNFFHGKMDDVRVYKRALCDNEIKIIYGLVLTLKAEAGADSLCIGDSVNVNIINPQPYIRYQLLNAKDSSIISSYKYSTCGETIVLNTGKIDSNSSYLIKAYNSDSNCFLILDTVI